MGKEKPILFSTKMVAAIIDGRKTQTRRVISKRYIINSNPDRYMFLGNDDDGNALFKDLFDSNFPWMSPITCPYGKQGDNLWVRETWRPLNGLWPDTKPSHIPADEPVEHLEDCTRYPKLHVFLDAPYERKSDCMPWWSPRYMPRWASRIDLTIKNIRVEQLNDITFVGEAKNEGIESFDDNSTRPLSENETRGYGWCINPWVWVIEFEKNNG